MDRLDASVATHLASFLTDERDVASLISTSRFWRGVGSANNDALWRTLTTRRFGAAAAQPDSTGGAGAASSSSGSGNGNGDGGAGTSAAVGVAAAQPPVTAAQRWRQLVSLRVPVAALERLIWLNGRHLERGTDPSSTFGHVIRVKDVWWLELGGTLPAVLPGWYRLAWCMRVQPAFSLRQVSLIARQLPAAAQCVEEQEEGEGEQPLELVNTSVGHQAITELAQQARGGWFELESQEFEVQAQAAPCTLWVELNGTSGPSWKSGLVLDSVRLVRCTAPGQLAAWQMPRRNRLRELACWVRDVLRGAS